MTSYTRARRPVATKSYAELEAEHERHMANVRTIRRVIASHVNAKAKKDRDKPTFAPMSALEKRAAVFVDRIYGAPPEAFAPAIRDLKRMRADGVKPGAAMRLTAERHGHDREVLAQAILDMRGAK